MMNYEYWKGEMTLYHTDSIMGDDDEGICMIADTKASPVTMCVFKGYEIKIEEIEGLKYITLHKSTKR